MINVSTKLRPLQKNIWLKLAILIVMLVQVIGPSPLFAATTVDNEKIAYLSQSTDVSPLNSATDTDPADLTVTVRSHKIKSVASAIDESDRPDMVIDAVITAYTSTVDQCDDDPFIAATGKHVYDGMIAANGLPFGTKIIIPSLYGDKVFMVDDRMNKRYGFGRMDIWLDTTKSEAIKFGVKRVEVEVYLPQKELAKI